MMTGDPGPADDDAAVPSYGQRRWRTHRSAAATLLGAIALGTAVPVAAHTGTGLAGGFQAGFLHPLSGFDYLLAMVSVGLWGAFLGRPLMIVLPVIFPTVMEFTSISTVW